MLSRFFFFKRTYQPEKLKIAKIVPVYKKGDSKLRESYRPISILPAISKIFEQIILRRLQQHFQKNGLLTKQQFAYQEGKGTVEAMKTLIATVCDALEHREKCAAQLCDLSQAFDTIPHQVLIAKMEQYGVRGGALQLLKSYLTHRQQKVSIKNSMSTFKETKLGVPQGSILGGFFFIVYVNDLPSCLNCTTVMYADDTTLLSSAKSNIELQETMEEQLTLAKQWFKQNTLTLNDKKTESITFQMDRWERTDPAVRFLGIQIDPRLTWMEHIETLGKKLSGATYAIRRINQTVSSEAARTTYFALFHARMTYGIEVWGHSAHTTIILTHQKRAVRAINGATQATHCKPLFQEHGILTVYAEYVYRCLCEIHNIKDIHPKQGDHHQHMTRAREDLRGTHKRLVTTSNHGSQVNLYNALPGDWKLNNLKIFKCTLKNTY